MKLWNKIKAQFPQPKNILVAFGAVLVLLFSSLILYQDVRDTNASADYYNSNSKLFGLNIPKNLNFAGERVPQTDYSIRENLEREFHTNSYWKKNSFLLFQRASRWFPIIEPILKRNGLPDDFKFIAVIESHLTNAVSPRGATGFWQLIESTSINYGLEVNEDVDERYHVEKSTVVACRFMLDAYKKFGNWTLAAASYNLGMGGVETKMAQQNTNSYYDLDLNKETGSYIYRLLAIKTILQNPKQFGFIVGKHSLYTNIPSVKLQVDTTINDLEAFAVKQGYSYKVLKIFNPWLRTDHLLNKYKNTYTIVFPKKEYMNRNFDDFETDLLKNEFKNDSLAILLTDTNLLSAKNLEIKLIHKVAKDETINSIAEFYEVSVQELCKWNSITEKTELTVGSEIIIIKNSVPEIETNNKIK